MDVEQNEHVRLAVASSKKFEPTLNHFGSPAFSPLDATSFLHIVVGHYFNNLTTLQSRMTTLNMKILNPNIIQYLQDTALAYSMI